MGLHAAVSTAFERAFVRTIGVEGGYSNDPVDRGGRTKYGITEWIARANGYQGAMVNLTLAEARRIAKLQYWDVLRLDDVAEVDETIAAELFDTGYNMGTGRAGEFLQRSLNALNREARDYPDLRPDGVVGPLTLAAYRAFVELRGALGRKTLLAALNALQGARYIEIAENDHSQERFTFGWLSQRVAA